MKFIDNGFDGHDYLERVKDNTEGLLLLHPSLLETELSKLEVCCPIGIVSDGDCEKNVFIPKQKIKNDKDNFGLMRYIPEDVIFPIGGLEGRYYVRAFQEYDHSLHGAGNFESREYEIYDRQTGKRVAHGLLGFGFEFFSPSHALFGNFMITKKNIMMVGPEDSVYSFDRSGCFIVEVPKMKSGNLWKSQFRTALYNADGDFVYGYTDCQSLLATEQNQPDMSNPSVPPKKNTQKFIDMIIECLKDSGGIDPITHKERLLLEGCEASDLLSISEYLAEKGIGIAVDLKTMRVHKVDYEKYFGRLNRQQIKGTSHTIKPTHKK